MSAAAGLVETPPVWVTTPPIQFEAGTWVRISGSVYVPVAIAGSLDGLMVLDSYGGEALAERVGESSVWKPFTLYRAAPRSGPLTVTICASPAMAKPGWTTWRSSLGCRRAHRSSRRLWAIAAR